VQPDADGIIYDPGSDRILVSAGDSNSLITFRPDVDPKAGKVEAPISLGGAPEFLAADGAGKVYVNLEDKDNIAVVDLKTRKVIAYSPVAPGGAPVGLAIDTAHHTLVIGCRKPQKMIVMSAESGKVLADLPIGAGVDAVKIDSSGYFASAVMAPSRWSAPHLQGNIVPSRRLRPRLVPRPWESTIAPTKSTCPLQILKLQKLAQATGR
jgi:DNA-binding beta-propeller fold protein YncE